MKLLLHLSLILLPFIGYSQAGTIVNYTDPLGALTLTYAGLVNGKHSYSTSVDNLTISYSGSQWEITCCGGSLLHTSATATAMNPPNLSIGNWVDLLNNPISVLSGSGTTSALPVKLISFTGEDRNGYNSLNWTTASEINNAGFEIQRSTDGRDFMKIGWVKGQGNSSYDVNYVFEDKESSTNEEYYYRLKQIDVDGRFEYSRVLSLVNRDEKRLALYRLYPNPANGNQVTLNISSDIEDQLLVEMFDAIGKVVVQQKNTINKGSNTIDVDINEVSNGTYFIKVSSKDLMEYRKMIVAK